ncbi:MAG: hypothetical protein JWM59_1935 [Verrucomicrobiales bacterium]|nr:hypothetical protein [Verrucomicrobiales bacterium]
MKSKCFLLIAAAAAFLAAFQLGNAEAGAPTVSMDGGPSYNPPPPTSLWEVTVRPYGWLAGMEGTTGVKGYTAETDVSFNEILKNLEMTAALQAEVRHDRWMLLLDGMYLKMSGDDGTPGRLLSTIDVEVEQIMAEASIGYRIWENERGFLDVFAGVRYMHLDSSLGFHADTAGIESFSRDLASEAVSRVDSAVRQAVPQVQSRVRQAVESSLQQRVDQVLAGHPNLPGALELFEKSDGPVSDAIRELVNARLAVKAENLMETAAVASAAVSGTKARLRDKAQQAILRAEKKLAQRIEEALTAAVPDRVSGSEDWIDPIIGVRARYNFTSRFYAAARADIGGFGVGSDLAWQAYAGLGWQCGRKVTFELGYRCLEMDYTSGGFTYDTMTSGVFTGVGITF